LSYVLVWKLRNLVCFLESHEEIQSETDEEIVIEEIEEGAAAEEEDMYVDDISANSDIDEDAPLIHIACDATKRAAPTY